ncbi:Agmatinase [Pseudobacteroides cellulosolvens ATCC 35603 = DSM 2933]|uniref:Agmatinase n=1 Tax=Pseudobacteroides cellulosolvens ATCC 35603 = DSM 2933 TaxID=398512 RepID=A0A0L6JHM2_9FIRM|nr:Agmatinase [Pseudobacteroides cellulosolvens ATCC 35603 = DSM 2933]
MGLKDGNSTLPVKFMASCEEYNDAEIVLVGVPMDFTCSFRPGTRFGPQKIREVSIGIEEYSVYMDKDLTDSSFFDCGDLDMPFGNVEGSLKLIGDSAQEILDDGKFPIFIGGEHLISVPVIKEVHKKYGDELIVLHFDAHADLREVIWDVLTPMHLLSEGSSTLCPEKTFISSALDQEQRKSSNLQRITPICTSLMLLSHWRK